MREAFLSLARLGQCFSHSFTGSPLVPWHSLLRFRVPVIGCCRDCALLVLICACRSPLFSPTTAPAAPVIRNPPLNLRHGATSQRCQPCFQRVARQASRYPLAAPRYLSIKTSLYSCLLSQFFVVYCTAYF